MIINHNIAALNTYRQMSFNSASTQNNIEKLSSGLRINKASDDAAGLAISEKMRGQIRGLDQASRNAQDAISLIQTAEGGLSETHSILQRMREIAVQSANDTSTDSDRSEMQKEISQLKSEIDRISSDTEFNTKKLLNGNLTGAKALQGTKAASAVFDATTTAATSGTSKAGLQVAISEAAAGTTGEGYSITSGAALAERTIIQTGVNDTFDITINGVSYADAQIEASTSEGYTRSQFVDALNAAVKAKVTAVDPQDVTNQFNQVVVSLTDDNHLKITTAATGSSSVINVAVADPTTATANMGALEAMGFSAKQTTITGNADLSAGITNLLVTDTLFNIELGDIVINGEIQDIDLVADGGLTLASNYSFEELKTALQTALDKRVGSGAITVGDDGLGHLQLTSNVATGVFKVAAATTVANDASDTLFGTTLTSSDVPQSANLNSKGVNTVNAVNAGTVISAGVNDKFNISVDGGETKTITLNAGNYATRQDLVTEISNQINSNDGLVGKVRVQLAADNSGKIEFISSSTGSSSDVSISNPAFANETALSALGYAGSAGGVTGTVDLASGLDLTTAANRKMDVTLGNKTVTIDLTGQTGIFTDTGGTTKLSSRDAIMQALQAELDDAFGEGAITVNTSTDTAGVDTFALSNNTRTAVFKIAAGAGATALFGGAKTAEVSVAGVNVELDGTDAVDNTIANSTKLTELADADSNNLGLVEGNLIKISGTQNGEGFSTSLTVGANSTLNDLQNAIRSLDAFHEATISLDTTTGKINISGANGATKDISNLAFVAQKSSTDSTIVSGFNSLFGSFNVTQQAQNASSDSSLKMQIGANQAQTLSVDFSDMGTDALRLTSVDISTKEGAQSGVSVINNALETVSAERSKMGALQNRLEHTINNLGTSSENLTASESRIRDVDMAKEMMEFTKNNVLTQAAQAMLAQANQQPQQVLQLLR